MNTGKWKITKFWDYVYDDVNPNSLKSGWNYEVAYWIDDDVLYEEYLEECIKEEKK